MFLVKADGKVLKVEEYSINLMEGTPFTEIRLETCQLEDRTTLHVNLLEIITAGKDEGHVIVEECKNCSLRVQEAYTKSFILVTRHYTIKKKYSDKLYSDLVLYSL